MAGARTTQNIGKEPARVRVIAYDESRVSRVTFDDGDIDVATIPTGNVTWFDVIGGDFRPALTQLRRMFDIHPLMAEDIERGGQRTKVERHGDALYFFLRCPPYEEGAFGNDVAIVVVGSTVITFSHAEIRGFVEARDRIDDAIGDIRSLDADYLGYRLTDGIFDQHEIYLYELSERTDDLAGVLIDESKEAAPTQLTELRHEVFTARRVVSHYLRVFQELCAHDAVLVSKATQVYFRDSLDHALRQSARLDTLNDQAGSLFELQLALSSQRLNDTMRVLTMVTSIFVPLSFLAGVFGMNFSHEASKWNMPELYWAYGYPAALLLMAVTAFAMVRYFKKSGWW